MNEPYRASLSTSMLNPMHTDFSENMQRRLQTDSVLQQMQQDETSLPFVQLRIKELLSDGLVQRFQATIEKKQSEIEGLWQEKQKLQENLELAIEDIKELDEMKLSEEARSELMARESEEMEQKYREKETDMEKEV